MRRLIILPAFVEDWGVPRGYGPFAASSVLPGCLPPIWLWRGSLELTTLCPALTLPLTDQLGITCGVIIYFPIGCSLSSLSQVNKPRSSGSLKANNTVNACCIHLKPIIVPVAQQFLPNSPLSAFSSIKMPGQKLYPRATVKKIVKAHSNCSVSKNADVMVPRT